MSSRADREAGAATLAVVAIAALALLVPLTALSGIATADRGSDRIVEAVADKGADRAPEKSTEEPRVLEQKAARQGNAKGATYSLRCWQYGRLVFEENGVRVDFDQDGSQTRLRGADRHGDPLIVTDTRNATCLIRSERPDASRGR